MKPFSLKHCWAKTDPETGLPSLSVTDHCILVGSVAQALWARLPKRVQETLPEGSVTLVAAHDIGKLTPGFQLKAPLWPWHEALQQTLIADGLTTNHAIVSQWHLQCIESYARNKKQQYWFISTGGHHGRYPCGSKPLKRPPYEGGNQSFISLRDELLQILVERFGALPSELAKNEAERIHLLTGFTIFSDWIGSNSDWFPPKISTDHASLAPTVNQQLDVLKWNPSVRSNRSFGQQFNPISPNDFAPRPIQQTLLQAADTPGLYIVEAPMGMGKTEAALTTAYQRWTQGDERGLYFALPTQLTSNKIHDRITDFLRNTLGEDSTQALIHGNAWLGDKKCQRLAPTFEESEKEAPENEANDQNEALRWYNSTRKQLIAPFGTGTIDQALLAVLPARFAALRYFALAGKVVVIDEVHSFDPYMSALIDRLIRYLLKAGSTVIILSATLTAQRRAELVQAADAIENDAPQAYPLITKVATGASHASHIPVPGELPQQTIHLHHSALDDSNQDAFWDQIAAKVEAGANVVVIRNTVALAQETYRQLKARLSERIPPEHVGLLHSRFPQNERDRNEEKWTSMLGKGNKDGHSRPTGSLLVSTQIVEQSVDIDADCLVTDLAPTELILQRIGRLHRHVRTRPAGCEQAICHILHPSSDWQGHAKAVEDALKPHHYVYPALSIWRAAVTLSAQETIQLPDDIRPLLEEAAARNPAQGHGEALARFVIDHTYQRDKMLGTAKLRDVFNASAIEDKEGTETRYGIKPTALLVILPSTPIEQGGRVTWQLPDGTTESHYTGEFNFAVAKALQSHATRIPAYLVKPQLTAAPDWLKQHLDSGVLAIQASDSSELQCYASDDKPYTLYYRSDIGVTYEKSESTPYSEQPEDFWF
ncbi:CRISPR-associated helicase Cas3' [Coraliomargarita sp. SDUM461003]|uniref:CRISPR-associated helicase Cas3 n=1 Tax=Thalassobacterium maritimum TaxID=3041265 RepID=A0ABU1AZA0_9BACT|nr:CRISPR-associated helicase Cas3' [Coraliomargarita sp. SDUM461003]MDQ8209476.1 CRISPR-associated helicase Cas3' [Coraliomargarita sp. SDUM461003]